MRIKPGVHIKCTPLKRTAWTLSFLEWQCQGDKQRAWCNCLPEPRQQCQLDLYSWRGIFWLCNKKWHLLYVWRSFCQTWCKHPSTAGCTLSDRPGDEKPWFSFLTNRTQFLAYVKSAALHNVQIWNRKPSHAQKTHPHPSVCLRVTAHLLIQKNISLSITPHCRGRKNLSFERSWRSLPASPSYSCPSHSNPCNNLLWQF